MTNDEIANVVREARLALANAQEVIRKQSKHIEDVWALVNEQSKVIDSLRERLDERFEDGLKAVKIFGLN